MTDADRTSRTGPFSIQRRAFLGALAGGTTVATLLLGKRLVHTADEDSPPNDGPGTVVGARTVPSGEIPRYTNGGPSLSFLALGDAGLCGRSRSALVEAMERVASTLPFSFVCLLGDNFYPYGVSSTADPRWSEFERAFDRPHLAIPFRAALGNHDHHGNVEAQVEYSALSARWRMPGQYYAFAERAVDFDAEFFVLDTECIRRDERASNEQLRWFEDKLERSRARWKVVIGHHPVRSNGVHGDIDSVRDAIEDLLQRHGAALYLSGHDHDLELLETGRGFLQVVSGAGSGTRGMRWGSDTLFASAAPGFVWIGLERDRVQLVFVDAERGPLFARAFALQDVVAPAPVARV